MLCEISSDNYFVTTVVKNIHWHTSPYFHVSYKTPLCLSCPSIRTELKICSSRLYNDNILIQGQAEVILFFTGKSSRTFQVVFIAMWKSSVSSLSQSLRGLPIGTVNLLRDGAGTSVSLKCIMHKAHWLHTIDQHLNKLSWNSINVTS